MQTALQSCLDSTFLLAHEVIAKTTATVAIIVIIFFIPDYYIYLLYYATNINNIMNRDSKSIFNNYRVINEQQQQIVKIGNETINLPILINAIDSSDLDLKLKNQLKSILLTKTAGSGGAGAMTPPSAMGGQPVQQTGMQSAPVSMMGL